MCAKRAREGYDKDMARAAVEVKVRATIEVRMAFFCLKWFLTALTQDRRKKSN